MGGVVTDDILLARAFLSRVAEPACIPVWDLVRRLGPVAAARVISDGTGSPDVSAATAARREHADAQADLDAAQRHGIRLVVPESADWPHFAFAALERTGQARLRRFDMGEHTVADSGEPMPPLALWVKGPGDLASLGGVPWGSSDPAPPRPMASTSRPISASGWPVGASSWCPAGRTASTPRPIVAPLRRAGRRSSCRPAGWIAPTRTATPHCLPAPLSRAWWCRRARPALHHSGTDS